MSLYALYYILNQREWAIKLWQWRILCWLLFSYCKGNKIITVKLNYALGNNWERLWSSIFDKTLCPMEQDYKILQKRLPFLDELFGISEEQLQLGIWMFSTLGQVFCGKKPSQVFVLGQSYTIHKTASDNAKNRLCQADDQLPQLYELLKCLKKCSLLTSVHPEKTSVKTMQYNSLAEPTENAEFYHGLRKHVGLNSPPAPSETVKVIY